MAALTTVQDLIDDARTLLQDTIVPYRYDNASLLTALNVTVYDAVRVRADLFLADGTTTDISDPPTYTTVDTTTVDIEPPFRVAFVYGICAHALLRDQEDIQDQRAAGFMALFQKILGGN